MVFDELEIWLEVTETGLEVTETGADLFGESAGLRRLEEGGGEIGCPSFHTACSMALVWFRRISF